jgi:hypothetical protein
MVKRLPTKSEEKNRTLVYRRTMHMKVKPDWEWVGDFCLIPAQQFSAISWREQVNFKWDDDEVRFHKTNTLTWIFIVLAHWNNSPRINVSPHSDILSAFRANQFLLFLLNDHCLEEKQHLQFYKLTHLFSVVILISASRHIQWHLFTHSCIAC